MAVISDSFSLIIIQICLKFRSVKKPSSVVSLKCGILFALFMQITINIMKTIYMKIAGLLMLSGLFLASSAGYSHDNRLSRQEMKEVKKARMAESFYFLGSLLDRKTFVLEADFLENTYGYRLPVTSTLNFIIVEESKGVLQTGADSRMGYNGVGGVTAEGTVKGWKLLKDPKKMVYRLHFNLMTNIGTYDIFMTITADYRATATISGQRHGKLTWEGHLVPISDSRVYKGTTL